MNLDYFVKQFFIPKALYRLLPHQFPFSAPELVFRHGPKSRGIFLYLGLVKLEITDTVLQFNL